jgi:tRNA(adenine34) deaminase
LFYSCRHIVKPDDFSTVNDTKRDSRDEYWMRRALNLAQQAEQEGEVPVGAVLVLDDELIGEGWNRPIVSHDPSSHAEINAIRAASLNLSNYRLPGTELYVTLEPCVMCAGAIIHARIERLVFGAHDAKAGAAGSVFNILPTNKLNHQVQVSAGVMEASCAEILQTFFKQRRQMSKQVNG